MAYEFKNLNEVPAQEKPTENTKVMAFESGNPRQIPASEFGGKGLIFELNEGDYTSDDNGTTITVTKNYDPLYDALMSGCHAVIDMKAPGSSDMYAIPGVWTIRAGQGFIMNILTPGGRGTARLVFTNGSHHSTT